VCAIRSARPGESSITDLLLEATPEQPIELDEQWKDCAIQMLVNYLEQGVLPEDTQLAHKVTSQATLFT